MSGRPRGTRPTRPAAIVAGALLAAAAGEARAAAWHVHHARALDHLASGDGRAAEAELREALLRRSRSACRARMYGVLFRDYVPHYQLGLALQMQGRDAEAAVEYSRELAQGVIEDCPATKGQLADLESRLAALATPGASEVAAASQAVRPTTGSPAVEPAPAGELASAAPAAAAAPLDASPVPEPAAPAVVPPPPGPPVGGPRGRLVLAVAAPGWRPLLGVDWSLPGGRPPSLLPVAP